MGNSHNQYLKGINLQQTPIYCMGFASDIHFAANNDQTNQVLTKLKQYESNQLYKYRIRQPIVLQYFCQYAHTLILLRPYSRSENSMGIIYISDKYKLRVQSIMMILRRELKIDEKQSIFLYLEGKLCQTHQVMSHQKKSNQDIKEKTLLVYFSKMEISG